MLIATASAAEAEDRDTLRRDWHRCLRQHFSGQPASLSRQAAERVALAACKSFEDANVQAELKAQRAEDEAQRGDERGWAVRARAVLSSLTAYVVEPVSILFGAAKR